MCVFILWASACYTRARAVAAAATRTDLLAAVDAPQLALSMRHAEYNEYVSVAAAAADDDDDRSRTAADEHDSTHDCRVAQRQWPLIDAGAPRARPGARF